MEQGTNEIPTDTFLPPMYGTARQPGLVDLQEVKMSEVTSKRENIEKLAQKILDLFPDGINSILQAPNPKDDDVYCMMIINCTENFHKTFSHQASANSCAVNCKMMGIANKIFKLPSKQVHQMQDDQLIPIEGLTEGKVLELIQDTQKYRKLIHDAFEELDMSDELLLNTLITKLADASVKKLKSTSEDYYQFCSNIYNKLPPSDKSACALPYYYELHFQDFLFLLCSILKYFTGLFVKLELSDVDSSKAMVILFGDELKFNVLAEHFEYELQLKPYAYKFAKCIDELTSTPTAGVQENCNCDNKHDRLIVPTDDKWKNLQFEELNPENPLHWPPYKEYESTKDEKFRRYERDDTFHDCVIDPEFNPSTTQYCDSCSKFRNIDKLRLIFRIIDYFLKLSFLYRSNILSQIVYKRNPKSYKAKISNTELMCKSWNIFNTKSFLNNVTVIRNYLGESIGFYFLWLISYNKWLLFPAIIGIIAQILLYSLPSKTFSELNFSYSDLCRFIMCVLITFWATLFLKVWKQNEKIFAYFWGMENYQRNEPNTESFVPDKNIPFIFGVRLPKMHLWKKYLKITVSYLVLLLMIILTVSIVVLLFRIKFWMAEEGMLKMEWTIIIASANACQIKIMSMIYEFIATRLNEWENHEKSYQKQNSLAVKLILFEFINNYFALFYISFCKPILKEPCQDNNCIKEIGYQLYTILLINFGFNFLEIGVPYMRHRWRMIMANRMLASHRAKDMNSNIQESITNDSMQVQECAKIEEHSVEHDLLCDGYTTLIYEYNERIIQFGYVCMFSIAAPFTPFVIFLLTYLEKYVDTYNIFNLQRVEIIEGSTGLEIYNGILRVFYFIGMLTSVALVLFTSNLPSSTHEFVNKLIVFAVLENGILLLIRFVKWNNLPIWFEHLTDLKELYEKKYYSRDSSSLPHVSILEEAERNRDEKGNLKKEFIEETLKHLEF